MLPRPTYFILLALCWIYALLRGGKPERIAATMMIFGTAVTPFAFSEAGRRFGSIEIGVLLVDLTVFAVFAILALRSDRFWRSGRRLVSGSACWAIWDDGMQVPTSAAWPIG